MNQLKNLLLKIKDSGWKGILLGACLVLLCAGLILDNKNKPSSPSHQSVPSPQVHIDQLAPPGHSLFPIQPLNYEALSGVLGVMGKVDIYDAESSRLIVDGLKLVRSQDSPDTLLALVPDAKMSQMIQVAPKIIAVLKNPKETTGTNFVRKTMKSQRSVTYGVDPL